METVIVALITSGFSLFGVIVSNMLSNRRVEANLEKAQAITDTKIDMLTREVREHNNFAKRMPVVEEQIIVMGREIRELKGYHKPQ